MLKGKLLSVSEKAKILAFKEAELSNREIARKLNRNHNLIDNFLNLKENYGKNHPKGGNKKLSRRDLSAIFRLAEKENVSAQQIKDKLQLPVTKRHIQQILSESKRFKWRKMAIKPFLTCVHKEARLNFAKAHMTWDSEWRNVIFSDEKKFNLDGPDGFKYYWHDLRKNRDMAMSRNSKGGSVMVWVAFSYYNKTPICWISTKMDSEAYLSLLENVLIDFGEQMPSENWIFQQDNAPIHVSAVAKQWFEEKNIECIKWPSRSPDLNPIENLWGILSRKVYQNGKQYSTVQSLKDGIKAAWSSIAEEILHNLVNSMKSRVFAVIQNKGGNTKY